MGQQTLPPGFRFSPTDEELVLYYLKSKALGKNSYRATIADVDVYKFEPWDLPGKAALPSKDQEWYFFSSQDKKYSHTARINRTTKKGYWKATGKDRKVFSGSSVIGLKKTLIYYEGRAPNGGRTNWIMHEYRLDEEFEKKEGAICVAVLCRIRKKGGPGPRNGEQYGALILNENVELEEEESMGKVDGGIDTSRQDDVESRGGGNVYNLTDQVEIWKQMGLSNVKSDHSGTKEYKETGFPKIESDYSDLGSKPNEKGMVEGDPDLFAYLQSLSDASDMAPLHAHGGDTFLSCDQYLDVQNPGTLFDLDAFPYLPTVWDADGHLLQNYTGSAFDESEILREMSALITDGQGVVGSTGSMIRPTACNVPLDGDYIELDDIKPPLDGFALRPPVHSSELGRSEEQLLWSIADTNVETQKLLHSQGSAAQTTWLPTRTGYERLESARFAIPQAEKYIREGDISIPISREHYRDSGKQPSGCSSGAGDLPHVAESSTRSYLSKHVSTYAVSKHEVLPAQLFYASSFTDRHKCAVTVNSSPAAPSTAAFAIKGKPNIDADTLRKFPTPPIGLPPSPRLLTKSRKDRAADALKKLPPPVSSPLSCSPPIKSNSSPYVEVPSATEAFKQKAEHENMNYPNRHRWKIPFRVLVSRAKRISLGTRLMELENGMRVKLNDKLSSLGKPGARFLPTRGDASPFESLVQGLLATMCQLVAAMLIFFCLSWGFRVLVSCASSVSV